MGEQRQEQSRRASSACQDARSHVYPRLPRDSLRVFLIFSLGRALVLRTPLLRARDTTSVIEPNNIVIIIIYSPLLGASIASSATLCSPWSTRKQILPSLQSQARRLGPYPLRCTYRSGGKHQSPTLGPYPLQYTYS